MLSKRSVVKGPGFVCGSWARGSCCLQYVTSVIIQLRPVLCRLWSGELEMDRAKQRGGHTHGTPRLQPSMEKLGIEDGARFYMELDSPRTTVTPRAVRAALSFFPAASKTPPPCPAAVDLSAKTGVGILAGLACSGSPAAVCVSGFRLSAIQPSLKRLFRLADPARGRLIDPRFQLSLRATAFHPPGREVLMAPLRSHNCAACVALLRP